MFVLVLLYSDFVGTNMNFWKIYAIQFCYFNFISSYVVNNVYCNHPATTVQPSRGIYFPQNHILPLPPFQNGIFFSPQVGTVHYRLAKMHLFSFLSKRLCRNSSPYWISFSFPPFFPIFLLFSFISFPFHHIFFPKL